MSSDVIRDYIYLDTNRSRSIYSQLRGGLLETFVRGNQTNEEGSQSNSNRKETIEQSILLGSKYEETNVLHDYLFSEIEKDLSESIITISNENNIRNIDTGNFVRISGKSEIDDTARLLRLAKNFNTLNAYISMTDIIPELQKKIWDIANKIDFEDLKNQQEKRLEKELASIQPPALFRRQHLGIHDLTIEMISTWLELLYTEIFEIKIIPEFTSDVAFRGVINTEYLREKPSLIYAKHSTRTQAKWTMVGQVTAIYSPESVGQRNDMTEENQQALSLTNSPSAKITDNTDKPNQSSEESILDDGDNNNIRDQIESIFETIKPLEEHMLISAHRQSIVMTPLAIYQESST